jgi:REP element-mobilizing transposase RayT
MGYDRGKHHRRSIRLPGYDYASVGAYFVTICVHGGECLLGGVLDGEMQLSEWGQVASESWQWLETQYPYVSLDAWTIMPNHLHGIIVMDGDLTAEGTGRGGSRTAPTAETKRKPLGRLIGAFKTVSTKRIDKLRDMPGVPFWQRNYWEHIIRNEDSLNRIRRYIEGNPARWAEDQLHPAATPNAFNQWPAESAAGQPR